MVRIGLVGGMGPESTLDYYRQLTSKYQKRHPQSYPEIVIDSLDVYQISKLEKKGQTETLIQKLLTSIKNLQASGADVAALTANTPHMVFDQLQTLSPIPLISIVDVTANAIKHNQQSKVGLLGTKMTMKEPFYKNKLAENRIQVVVPSDEQINHIYAIISSELKLGVVKQSVSLENRCATERLRSYSGSYFRMYGITAGIVCE
ncbi:MAG: amino acid racemase [Lentilactobacillus diolivorans]|jgi:aspartate racemase|nr:amino acid racemase [Lentilactobacillus diolivorans]